MSKSVLYAANSNTQTLTTGSTISFGSIVRRYGSNLNLSGGDVSVKGEGYYSVDSNFTFEPTTPGTVIITLYKNGVAIPGAVATFTTVADTIYSVTIPAMVRQSCCSEGTITAIVTGEGTISNASIKVVKE